MTRLPEGVDFVVIAGPTGVGKTAVAVELAKELGGEIISADSMQVYSELSIGTGRPTKDELQNVPYHLVGFLSPAEQYSAGRFRRDAVAILEQLKAAGKPAIVCGGTGLYIKALLYGLLDQGEVNPEIRQQLLDRASNEGIHTLYEELLRIDPEAARIKPNDKIRVVRELEIYTSTKTRPATIKTQHAQPPHFHAPYFVLTRSRESLYQRINDRVDLMVQNGLMDEVRDYLESDFSEDNPAFKALGYRDLATATRNEIPLENALEIMKQKSRRYAKRQMTWFRGVKESQFISSDDLTNSEIARVISRKLWTTAK